MCSLFTIISSTYIFFTFLLMENARCIWVLFFFCFFFSLFKVFPLTGRIKMKSVMIFSYIFLLQWTTENIVIGFHIVFFLFVSFHYVAKSVGSDETIFGGSISTFFFFSDSFLSLLIISVPRFFYTFPSSLDHCWWLPNRRWLTLRPRVSLLLPFILPSFLAYPSSVSLLYLPLFLSYFMFQFRRHVLRKWYT